MDKNQDSDQVKKFLGLIKQAQNEALIGLICEGLAGEVKNQPVKATQAVFDFLSKELVRGEASDFTRLKVAELIIPVLNQDVSQILFDTKLNSADANCSNSKQIERLERCQFVVRLDQDQPKMLRMDQIKNLFQELINNYEPLLSSDSTVPADIDPKAAKEQTKAGIKKVLMGDNTLNNALKLSDFIDEKFLEDIDQDVEMNKANVTKTPVSELIKKLERQTESLFGSIIRKRQKSDEVGKPTHVIMSPILALICYQTDNLLSVDWKRRQVAACQLLHIFDGQQQDFEYSVVSQSGAFILKTGNKITKQDLADNVLTRTLICLLKDNFSDFEGLKIMVPVREQCYKLIGALCQFQVTEALIQCLPQIFLAVENDNWHSKLNFFLILKGIAVKGDKKLKETILMMFGNMLIQAIPLIEDEPKVAVTELLQLLLPTYYQSFNNPKTPTKLTIQLLDNLTSNLKKLDEIEASAIAVFNLICKIFEQKTQQKCLSQFKYKLDLQVVGLFNFHKLEPVRLSYNSLILTAVESGSFTAKEDLCLIVTLVVQALAVEQTPAIVQMLLKVLQSTLAVVQQSDLLQYLQEDLLSDDRLPNWLVSVEPDFKTFKFLSSPNFDTCNGDYFKIVFRPANEQEWERFYYQKMENLIQATSFMLGKAPDVVFDAICKRTVVFDQNCGSQPVQTTLLNQALLQMMLVLEHGSRNQIKGLDPQYVESLSWQFLQAQECDVSTVDCWQVEQLMESVNQLLQYLPAQIKPVCQNIIVLLDDCIMTQTFRHLDELCIQIQCLGQWVQQDKNLNCLFIRFTQIWQTVVGYAQQYCLRLKQASSSILISMNVEQLQGALNLIIKPLLMQLNQEKVDMFVKPAAQSLASLVVLLDKRGLFTAMKRVLEVVQSTCTSDSAQLFYSQLIKLSKNIFNDFRGFIGYHVLQPNLSNTKQVNLWIQIAGVTVHGMKGQNLNYHEKAFDILISLIQKSLNFNNVCGLPEFFEQVFLQCTAVQQQKLMQNLEQQIVDKNTMAFECLDMMMSKQINKPLPSFLVFVPLFILPVIKCLQYQIYPQGEKKVMQILARLLQLLPLNINSLQANVYDRDLQDKIDQGMAFLKVFASNQVVQEYPLIIKVNAKLRDYQKQGINWMAKLGSFNLNCALCDDMGLGKTLQSLTVVLNETKKLGSQRQNLVVCPTSLTYNWLQEINKFFTQIKAGTVDFQNGRQVLENLKDYDVVVVSYEKLKNCMPYFENHRFFYVVLDEAHKIKNSKSVTAQTVNKLKCDRKIALSGTPLQNRVCELWSLFDFLLPDFLEDETTFNKLYNKYLTGNVKRMQENLEQTQQYIDALKSLKRRIAPFILRRTKEDVLKELPPKVIQDYECVMPVSQANAHNQIEKRYPFSNVLGSKAGQSTLQNLILHRKVCNHPYLVNSEVPSDSQSYEQSGKLIGLTELLQLSEIILEPSEEIFEAKQSNRALLFCQMQSFMSLVETQVLNKFGIKYLALKSTLSSKERVDMVDQFNNDNSYKVMILTTAVGGLGLTLTGANMVIFLEHDWNPMKDLQAMDRAHRIGQTRTVNVYRLILKETIEEKIMSLQRFKQNLARSLIQNKGELVDDQGLELTDLLKSFEQHTAYQKQTQVATKKEGKLTMAQVINQSILDADIDQIANAFNSTDFEKL